MGIFNRVENPEAGTPPPATPPEKSQSELLAEALGPVVAGIKALGERITTVEQNTKRPVTPTEPTELPSVFDDENLAISARIAPVLQRQLEVEARITYNEVKAEYIARGYGDLFSQFEAEIKQVLDGSPIVQQGADGQARPCRGDRQYIENVITMVFGRAALKSGMKFGGKDRGFFIESAGGDAGTGQPSTVDDGMSASQRKVFNRMGVSPDDAKKTMAKLKFVS